MNRIFLTPRAKRNFENIVDFIKKEWGDGVAQAFIVKVDDIFNLLKNFPQMGQVEEKEIRGFQITPQTRILYRLKGDKIIILSFFDVRQSPKIKGI
ncbi:Plasmid stabilization system protein ParE [Algoriphagus faecimaris]|uniref:Plasmid stabilization system protein ParE n=1 Tax=Algoriphagus faecimaris TaxID=686796 RepID=A0A1G6TE31_9BACT|nr:type II toxin-antitoxin system RelE/ParE family toxin [Algoriphagus faecimaris]SDD27289.1 Plasmid stabilization system protein ParE [Algoriphagus faecimaris]